MPLSAKDWIVETDWLAEYLNAPDLIVFDGSWICRPRAATPRLSMSPTYSRRPVLRHRRSRRCSCPPHMLPSTVKFAFGA